MACTEFSTTRRESSKEREISIYYGHGDDDDDDDDDDGDDDDDDGDGDPVLAGWLRSGWFLPLSPFLWW